MAKKSSLREEIDGLKETVAEIRDATVDKERKPSMAPSALQRGVESIAGRDGWNLAKDVGRAFIPQKIEALARSKMRGEDYEDASAKAEESREDLENRRSGLHATGAATQSLAATVAGIALYAKLANSGASATPVAPPVPAPAPAPAPRGNIKAMGRFGLIAAAGAAVGSYLMSQRASSAPAAAPAAPAPAVPQPIAPAAAAKPMPSAPPVTRARPAASAQQRPAQAKPKAQKVQQQQKRRQAAQQKQRRGSGPVEVPGYTRADGVQVQGYRRQRTM